MDRTPHAAMTTIVRHDEATEILRSSEFRNTLTTRRSSPITGLTIGGLVREEHMDRRRNEMELFSRRSLADYEFGAVVPTVRDALNSANGGRADLLEIMRGALLRVSAMVIGLDEVDSPERTAHLHEIADRVGEAASVEWTTGDPDAVVRRALEAKEDFVDSFYSTSLDRRRSLVRQWQDGHLQEDTLPHDLLTVLLKHYGDWDDDLRLRECLFYLAAATSTTTNASPHVFAELAAWCADDPGRAARTQDLSFLQRAVAEALRLHPPVPGLLRSALSEVQLSSGRSIASGEQLYLDLMAINRDPEIWGDDALAFEPDRTPRVRSHLYASSFAAGPHTCPGRLIAVGAGNGQVGTGDAPIGVLVRLVEQLFRHDVRLDPESPPVRRTDTLADRYAEFPVIIGEREVSRV